MSQPTDRRCRSLNMTGRPHCMLVNRLTLDTTSSWCSVLPGALRQRSNAQVAMMSAWAGMFSVHFDKTCTALMLWPILAATVGINTAAHCSSLKWHWRLQLLASNCQCRVRGQYYRSALVLPIWGVHCKCMCISLHMGCVMSSGACGVVAYPMYATVALLSHQGVADSLFCSNGASKTVSVLSNAWQYCRASMHGKACIMLNLPISTAGCCHGPAI